MSLKTLKSTVSFSNLTTCEYAELYKWIISYRNVKKWQQIFSFSSFMTKINPVLGCRVCLKTVDETKKEQKERQHSYTWLHWYAL